MYFNNLGIDELLLGNLPKSYAYLVKAIDVDPGASDSWSNLGVVLGRNGQTGDAKKAYLTALDIRPDQLTAMGNLYDIYIMEENLAAAADLQSRVERYRLVGCQSSAAAGDQLSAAAGGQSSAAAGGQSSAAAGGVAAAREIGAPGVIRCAPCRSRRTS